MLIFKQKERIENMKNNKQEILFKNVTKYDSKNYNQFIQFHNKKYAFF